MHYGESLHVLMSFDVDTNCDICTEARKRLRDGLLGEDYILIHNSKHDNYVHLAIIGKAEMEAKGEEIEKAVFKAMDEEKEED